MRKTELQINLSNLEHNITLIQSYTKSSIQAVVKANMYGLDIPNLIEILEPHVESFAVITTEEAAEVRKYTSLPILLLQGVHEASDYFLIEELGLDFVFHSDWQIESLKEHSLPESRAWLKIDTGMNRLGFEHERLSEIFDLISNSVFKEVVLMSHLASSSDIDNNQNSDQIKLFSEITKNYSNKKSLANSGAIFNYPESHFDIVRSGIALYGGKYIEKGIKPITRLRTQIIAIKKIRKGERVGYDGSWQASQDTLIAAISIGYGDGFPYIHKPFLVSINGEKYNTVGKINMDLITIDINHSDNIKVGDWVELWGFDTDLTELSSNLNSISYQLLTNLSRRVTKNYLE